MSAINIISYSYFKFYVFCSVFLCRFYYKLLGKNAKGQNGYLIIYEGPIKNTSLFFTFIGFNSAFAFFLSIPFLIIDYYLKTLILLISLPFKLYPLKYYFGIMYEGLRGNL